MRAFPLALPSPPPHLQPTYDVIQSWMQEVKGANHEQVSIVLAFLNEDYLRSIPLHVGTFFGRCPSGCKHWFHVFIA